MREWDEGLHMWQLDLVVRILDSEDVLCCTATGDGKSALFAAPIIVLQEMARNPGLYPDLPYRSHPVGLIVTPTKGLSANIVSFHDCRRFVFLIIWLAFKVKELKSLRVPALAYCKETVTEARKAGRKLAVEIKECKRWSIVCIDPKHLRDAEWREITEWPVFRRNVVFGCVDEAFRHPPTGPRH